MLDTYAGTRTVHEYRIWIDRYAYSGMGDENVIAKKIDKFCGVIKNITAARIFNISALFNAANDPANAISKQAQQIIKPFMRGVK